MAWVARQRIGALANWGIPKDDVREYESAIRNGGIPEARLEALEQAGQVTDDVGTALYRIDR